MAPLLQKSISLVLSLLLLVTSTSPSLLYAEEITAPVVENAVSVVVDQEVVTLVPGVTPVSEVSPTPTSTPTSVVILSESTTIITTPPTFSAPTPVIVSEGVLVPSVPSDTSIVTMTSDVVATEKSVVVDNVAAAEEEEEEYLDLGDDQTEIDALKDFAGVVRQSQPHTCGPAALATLLTQLGDDVSEGQVLENIQTSDISEEKGVTLLTLKNAAHTLGSSVILKSWSADQVLAYVQQTGDPVLIHDEKKDVGGHFSVIRSYNAENGIIELSDTEAGNIKYSVEDFRHIFTGHVLVIYEGDLHGMLLETTTNLSDEVAATIWGKYVPVYILAENSGNKKAIADAAAFRTCIANAIKVGNITQRNAARSACYDTMAKNLVKDFESNWEELGVRIDSKLGASSDKHLSGVGTSEILKTLNDIIVIQKNVGIAQARIDTIKSLTKGTTLAQLTKDAAPIQAKLDKATLEKKLLDTAITSKEWSIATTKSNIENGSFSQNNQSFSLGAIGKQITAKADTYKKLSTALADKLSNLDKQIENKDKQVKSLMSQKSIADANAATHQKIADKHYEQMRKKMKAKKSFTHEKKQYDTYWTAADNERKKSAQLQSQINQGNSDISTLVNQKLVEKYAVSTANAEKAQLEKLKSFGLKEIERQKESLLILKKELTKLQDQLPAKNTSITTLTAQIQPTKDMIALWNEQSSLVTMIATYTSQITELGKKYGYTTLTATNTAETQRLIDEELTFEKKQDQITLKAATSDLQYHVDTYAQIVVDSKFFQFPNGIVTLTVEDGLQCITNGGVQSCLSTCGVALDATGVGAPVAMLCDATNGAIYLFSGDKASAGASLLAVIPFVGTVGKQGVKTTVKLSEDAAKLVGKQASKNLAEELAIQEAKTNLKKGIKIIDKSNMKDPALGGKYDKYSYHHTTLNGQLIEVHYHKNPITGEVRDFKIKTY